MMLGLKHFMLLAIMLFGTGAIAVLVRRNMLVVLMGVELMLNASNLLLIAAARYHASMDGQLLAFFSMTVAAAEVAVGLALVVLLVRRHGSSHIDRIKYFRH